ncbi:MAG: hypothetical protein ACYC09_05195 [Bacteroidota bacterium]
MIKKHLGFLLLWFLIPVAISAQPDPVYFTSDTLLLFAPFKDNSGFKGKWNVPVDVPRYLSVYMKERFRVGIINPVSVWNYAAETAVDSQRVHEIFMAGRYAERFRTRFVVIGAIEEFSISRFMVSEVQLAGYEAFASTVKIHFVLYDAAHGGREGAQPIVYEGEAEGTVKDRGLGITLFGKQTDRTSEFFSLDELSFGSEQFNRTILGEALLKCAEELGTKLERAIPMLVSKSVVLSSDIVVDSAGTESEIVLRRRLVNGEIVIVDDTEVFINIGSSDGIAVGDILPVYIPGTAITDPKTGESLGSADKKIGEIQIIEVRAERLSLGTIISGKELIKPKHRIRKVIVR